MCYSLWYNVPTMFPAATGRQHRGYIVPQAVTHSLTLLKMGNCLKHVELIGIINKPLLLNLVGVYIIYINDARSNKYKIYLYVCGSLDNVSKAPNP